MSEKKLAEKVLQENILVHALENKEYLKRHPEQTNFFQYARLQRTINKAVNLLPDNNSNILDVGCGTGYLFLEFLRRGFDVTGIDISPELVAVLKDKIPPELKPKANLVNADAIEYLKQKQETFSLISISAFLHHLFDYEAVLRAACYALQKKGIILIFFEPLKQPIKSNIRYFFHKLLKGVDERIYNLTMFLQNISTLNEKYIYSDYQRRFGGLEIKSICNILKSENMKILSKKKYCARRYGIPSFIASNVIKSENSFDVIALKK